MHEDAGGGGGGGDDASSAGGAGCAPFPAGAQFGESKRRLLAFGSSLRRLIFVVLII